jgi:hypothetical protein
MWLGNFHLVSAKTSRAWPMTVTGNGLDGAVDAVSMQSSFVSPAAGRGGRSCFLALAVLQCHALQAVYA